MCQMSSITCAGKRRGRENSVRGGSRQRTVCVLITTRMKDKEPDSVNGTAKENAPIRTVVKSHSMEGAKESPASPLSPAVRRRRLPCRTAHPHR